MDTNTHEYKTNERNQELKRNGLLMDVKTGLYSWSFVSIRG